MSAPTLHEFQQQVSELLLRHRSLLDVVTKFSQAGASVNRAVAKSITECGCIELKTQHREFSEEAGFDQALRQAAPDKQGELCENCLDAIRGEMGKNLFYLSALCNLLDINMEEVVAKEAQKCSTLGFFNLT